MRPLLALTLLAASLSAQAPELGQGYLAELHLAERQTIALAEAIPADKYSWRPAPGVRSVSEVFLHVVLANYGLLKQSGDPIELDKVGFPPKPETSITQKAQVIDWLKKSFAVVRDRYPHANLANKVTFIGKPTTSEGVLLRLLVHDHEHMGQAIAYARMIGVTPPWSQ